MLSAEQALEHTERQFLSTGGVPLDSTLQVFDPTNTAVLRMRLGFGDGSECSVNLTIDTTPGYPLWVHYSFHLQDAAGACIARCDNAPHHQHLPTAPHHKHTGPQEVVSTAQMPILGAVVRVLTRYAKSVAP